MRTRIVAVLIVTVAVVAAGVGIRWLWFHEPALRTAEILASHAQGTPCSKATIEYPFPGAVFPPDIAAPTFRWADPAEQADAWVIRLQCPDGAAPLVFETRRAEWTPAEDAWSKIKRQSVGKTSEVTVVGVRRSQQDVHLAAAQTAFSVSPDAVDAPIFYREVNLPFIEAVKDPSQIRWRFGGVGTTGTPPIVLEKLPVCGNCHSFSTDGATMGLDVDYANDKGSYAILPVGAEMSLDRTKVFTWNDYRRDDRAPTFGLLSAVSPDGRYTVSTVKDRSVFVPTEDLAYSQLFFPIQGILAIRDRRTGEIRALPGADDPQYVQSNAAWSPDGKWLVFARSKAYRLRHESAAASVMLSKEQCQEFLTREESFRFDLYRIPFNDGKGGKAEPLAGASENGMSNYFARFSPDGKWIVYCRAKSFMLLQPDSQLWIIPSAGGEARRLACNLPGMNSWHSWSHNGRWLVFSSKAFTPYTQLFLTHIDARGASTPPVLLSRFTSPDRAANIPEFVNVKPGAIRQIAVNFLDDYNFARVARERINSGDLDEAEAACRKALELNPRSADALCNLGVTMARQSRLEEAIEYLTRAVDSDPRSINARMNLGHALVVVGRRDDAVAHYQEVVRLDPHLPAARVELAECLLRGGKPDAAIEQLTEAVRLLPKDDMLESRLAAACQRQGKAAEARAHYRSVLERSPDFVPALSGMAVVLSSARQAALRDEEEALRLARRACQLTRYGDPESLTILAAVHAETGRFLEAARTAQQALAAAQRSGNPQYIRAIEPLVQSYLQKAAGPLR